MKSYSHVAQIWSFYLKKKRYYLGWTIIDIPADADNYFQVMAVNWWLI